MRLLLLLVFLIQFSAFAEVDSLSIEDKTVLEIVNGKEIFQSEPDFWDKYSSGLIAMVTVILSLLISYYQAKKSIKATRANSISEARLQWIKEVRPLMSRLMTLVYEVEFEVNEIAKVIDLNTNQLKRKINEYEQGKLLKTVDRFKQMQYESAEVLFSLKLMLNPNEQEHKSFITLIETYLSEIEIKSKDENYTIETPSVDIVNAGNRIIKNAWEQSKNEGNKKK